MRQRISFEQGVAFLPGAKAMASFYTKTDDAASTKQVVPKDLTAYPWSWWGSDNLFPQKVLADLENNSIALRALEKRKTVHYGRGILAYREGKDEFGNDSKIPVTDQQVVDFLNMNRLNFQWIDLIGSLEIFANGWLEFILNKSKDKINRVYVKDPAYCRVGRMDPNKPIRIPYLYYSAQWEYAPSIDSGTIIRLPMFDPDKYDGKTYKEAQFAYPVVYKSFNKSYYHMAVWNGVRQSGWLNIANKVPRLKQAIIKNQMVIKYHIEIPDDYFTSRYPSPDYSKEEREAQRTKVLQEMNDFLADVENSGEPHKSVDFKNSRIVNQIS